MKNRHSVILLALVLCCVLSAAACTSHKPEVSNKVILDVDGCGWLKATIDNKNGRLLITNGSDADSHEFTHIYSPKNAERRNFFSGKGLLLERFDIDWSPAAETDIFVSEEEDYQYLTDMLSDLSFSTEISTRRELDARLRLTTYEQAGGAYQKVDEYYICSDGIVLQLAGQESIDNNTHNAFYESLEQVDYYRVSAIEIKYSQFVRTFYWECFTDSEGHERHVDPNNYRLCISSVDGHKDFTLEEARELLPPIRWIQEAQINNVTLTNADECLKFTEYVDLGDGEIQEKTYYLSREGKLISFRNAIASQYHDAEWEIFELSLIWVSEESLEYDEFIALLSTSGD